VYSSWYLDFLDARISKFAESQLAKAVMPLLRPTTEYAVPKTTRIEAINKSLTTIATEIASGKASIHSIAEKLHPNFATQTEPTLRIQLYQYIFRAISLLTLIYEASEEPKQNTFQLSLLQGSASRGTTPVRSRYQKTSVWEHLECGITTASGGGTAFIDLQHLSAHFGTLVPQQCLPSTSNRRDFYEDLIVASNVNFETLSQIGLLGIEWVESLSLHLELHEKTSKLRLFAYPSFCALLCEEYQGQKTFLSK
jgi:hypothetical protein